MENERLRERYRVQLATLHGMTVTVVSVLEIIAYFILVAAGEHPLSLQSRYLWGYVALPIAINMLAHTVVRVVGKSKTFADTVKIATLVYAVWVTAAVIALWHREHWVTACAYAFPQMLSGIFNDVRLCSRVFLMTLAASVVTTVILCIERTPDIAFLLSQVISYGFAVICYLSALLMVRFVRNNSTVISDQALANKQLRERIKRDPMTGLYNHRAFFGELEGAIEACEAENKPMCLAILDIDNFKSVNDTFGHDSGDVVLLALSDVIKCNCAPQDKACRYGGEEFAVIMEREAEDAESLLKTILAEFRARRYPFTDSAITFSCGLVPYQKGMGVEAFFSSTDKMLYNAKKNGKNRVCVG